MPHYMTTNIEATDWKKIGSFIIYRPHVGFPINHYNDNGILAVAPLLSLVRFHGRWSRQQQEVAWHLAKEAARLFQTGYGYRRQILPKLMSNPGSLNNRELAPDLFLHLCLKVSVLYVPYFFLYLCWILLPKMFLKMNRKEKTSELPQRNLTLPNQNMSSGNLT